MGDLAERYGPTRDSRGQSEFMPVKTLREPFKSFLSEAEIGDLSEVLPFENEGQVVGYVVLRVDEVKLPELPDFSDREDQRQFERRVANSLEQRLILEGLESLANAAYVWPPGALSGAPSSPAQPPEPGEAPSKP